jgi:carbon monoxide dehydrogenase subunit G
MEIKNSFEVPRPPAEAWKLLLDIERIAPCMPGAELLQVVDPQTYKGKVSVRLGPVALAFVGTAKFEEIDETAHHARVKAQGTDQKGRGGANAVVAFSLEPSPVGTRVNVVTNLNLSGSVAQYGRGTGMIQDVATQLIGQFASALQAMLAQEKSSGPGAAASPDGATAGGRAAEAAPPPAAKPISGFSLMLRVLWNALLRLFSGGSRPQ